MAFQALFSGGQDVVSGTANGVHEVVAKMLGYDDIFLKLHRSVIKDQRVTVLGLYYNRQTALNKVGYNLAFAILVCRPDEATGQEVDVITTIHQNDGDPLNVGAQSIILEVEQQVTELGGKFTESVK